MEKYRQYAVMIVSYNSLHALTWYV